MYIVNFLRELTNVGLVKWGGDEERGFDTVIGNFQLRVFKKGRGVEKKFFGKKKTKIKEHWILQIKSLLSKEFEEIIGRSDYVATSQTEILFWAAKHSAETKTTSSLQSDLYVTLLNTFGIKP